MDTHAWMAGEPRAFLAERVPVNADRCPRRHLLLGLIVGFGIAAVKPLHRSSPAAPSGYARWIAGRLFGEIESARAIGRLYLEEHPEEADTATLLNLLQLSAPLGASAARCRIAAQRMADFRTGELTGIDGWLLARTEARACALAALT